MKYIFIIATIMLCSLANGFAQSVKLFDKLDGLSNSQINDIEIDHNGMLWVATNVGINLFNGKSFVRHKDIPNVVTKIKELPSHDMMIGTSNGVLRYSHCNGTFTPVPFNMTNTENGTFVTDILVTDSVVYITTSGFGLCTLSMGDSLIRIHPISGVGNRFLQSVFIDSHQRIWLGSYSQDTYVITNGQAKKIESNAGDIRGFCEDAHGNIYAATNNNGVAKIDYNGNCTFIKLNEKIGSQFSVSSIAACGNRILIGSDGLGLWEYNSISDQTHNVAMHNPQFDSNKLKIHSVKQDMYGNIWLGVYQKGLVLIPKSSSMFKTFGYTPGNSSNIGSNAVGAICKYKSQIWVGTEGDGIYIIDKDGSTSHFFIKDTDGRQLSCNIISMYNQDDKYIWIGTYGEDFLKIDAESHKTIKNFHNKYTKVTSISEYGNGDIIITTSGNGMAVINTKTEQFDSNFPVNPSWATTSAIDHLGNLWIGTYSGLWFIDKQRNNSHRYSKINNELPDNSIKDIHIDSRNQIWCLTNKGVVILDPVSGHSKQYLESESPCAMVHDSMGYIWISTKNGLFRLEPNSGKINCFGAESGLQCHEYSSKAAILMDNGMACFGGFSGVTMVETNNIQDSLQPGKVYMQRLEVNNHEITSGEMYNNIMVLPHNIAETDTIYLKERDNIFSIMFGISNPACISHTQFKYRILEFGDHYTMCPNDESQVSFSNFQNGTYSLEIVAVTGDKQASRIITIVIYPNWYNTLWFRIIIGVVIMLILLLILGYFKEKIRRLHGEQINEMKMQFFVNISHEIRTPLTLIIDPLEKLLEKTDTDAGTYKLYQIMKTNSQRILRLVSQLLDLKKIDSGQVIMKFGKTELFAYIRKIVESCSPLLDTKEITIQINRIPAKSIYAWIDPENFEKIILNLIHNAVKFTPVGGHVEINIERVDSNDTIRIVVQDNGIGINNDDISKIFQRFYQVRDSQSRYTTGTGVGLHLARYLTELHMGKLYAENRTDKKGSRFIIELKGGKAHLPESSIMDTEEDNEPAKTEYTELPINPSKKTIIVVDDEESIRTYLTAQLEEDGYNVLSFENGKKAMDYITSISPDLIISDIMMEEMDGWTLCKKVKRNFRTSHIPVILLTALTDDDSKTQGIDIGADMYIEKPFNTLILKKIIKNMIQNRDKVAENIASKSDNYNIDNIELKSQDEILMEKVKDIIKEKISCRDLNVETLADTIGISRMHLHRKIKEITGLTARDYLKNLRMKQASYLLTDRNLSISEIAYAVGYSNPAHFSSSFKAFYGISPTEYASRGAKDNDSEPQNLQ
ncbi:MAG: response regulator [Bacteroidales bacterium]|nr:response regulator [Bacteroidales bacterium]